MTTDPYEVSIPFANLELKLEKTGLSPEEEAKEIERLTERAKEL